MKIAEVPSELLTTLFSFFTNNQRVSLRSVDTNFKKLAEDPLYWKQQCKIKNIKPDDKTISFFQTYWEHQKKLYACICLPIEDYYRVVKERTIVFKPNMKALENKENCIETREKALPGSRTYVFEFLLTFQVRRNFLLNNNVFICQKEVKIPFLKQTFLDDNIKYEINDSIIFEPSDEDDETEGYQLFCPII